MNLFKKAIDGIQQPLHTKAIPGDLNPFFFFVSLPSLNAPDHEVQSAFSVFERHQH